MSVRRASGWPSTSCCACRSPWCCDGGRSSGTRRASATVAELDLPGAEPRLGADHSLIRTFLEGLPFELTGAQRRGPRSDPRRPGRAASDAPPAAGRRRVGQDGRGPGGPARRRPRRPPGRVDGPDRGAGRAAPCGGPLADPSVVGCRRRPLGGERPLACRSLTNRTPAAERARIRQGLALGTVDLVVGTHALLTEDVRFRSLGVVVIDEQHRFGVEQRAALRDKGRERRRRGRSRTSSS